MCNFLVCSKLNFQKLWDIIAVMSIDRQKAPQLVSLLAASYGLFLTGCASASEYPQKPVATLPSVATVTPTPDLFGPPLPTPSSELLFPKTVREGAKMGMYQGGAIINLTRDIDGAFNFDSLPFVNTDPRYGINLGNGEQNLTYLFPQSFARGNGRADAIRIVNEELPLVILTVSRFQGIESGRMRFSLISLADVLTRVSMSNPHLNPDSEDFRGLASLELTLAYLSISGLEIHDIEQTPNIYPAVAPSVAPLIRRLLMQGDLPLALLVINPNYFTALGLVSRS